MNGSGLNALMQGFQQGYSFGDGVNRRKKQDARDDKEFARKEKGWKKEDDYDSSIAALNKQYGFGPDEEPPSAAAPPVAAAGVNPVAAVPVADAPQVQPMPAAGAPQTAAGVPATPKPKADKFQSMNNTLEYAIERAKVDLSHRKIDGNGMLTLMKTVDNMKREKLDDAINLLHQGRYDEAAQAFNSTGDHNGYKMVDAKEGVFKQGKTEVPTRIVTVQDANGNTRTINTAQTLFQRQEIGKVIEQAQKERDVDVREQHGKDVVAESARGHDLTYKANMAGVGVQQARLKLEQQKSLTPSEQLVQLEAALGRPLTPDERMTKLGVDKYSQTDRTAVQSLMKSQEQVSAAMFKAQADGTWQADSQGVKALMEKNAALALKINAITDKYQTEDSKAKKADPLRILESDMPAPPGSGAKKAAAGIRPAPQQTPADANGSVNISGDPVLSALAEQMKQIDANDPANMQAVIEIGKARAARLEQLQAKYGRLTKLNQ